MNLFEGIIKVKIRAKNKIIEKKKLRYLSCERKDGTINTNKGTT